MLALSILDLVPVASGTTSTDTLRNSLELARHADRLGYSRLWYAEHHNMPSIASTTPAIMIALAAETTHTIHVGAGGVMLPNHAPLAVAEAFKMLEALHPGRIDLGLGRAPGTDPTTAIALRGSRAALMADEFPEQLAQLVAFGQGDAQGRLRSVTAYPKDVPLPRIWLLGSSGYSSVLAAKLGLGFGFAAHFSPDPPEPPLLGYREQFRPSETFPKPHAILTVSAICAHTELEAERLAMSMQLAWVRLRTGVLSTIASPEEALAYPYTEQDRLVMQAYRQMQIVGTPGSVRSSIEGLAARTRADEVMITTVTHDPRARLTSYELLAEAFELPRSAPVVSRLSS